MTVTGESQLETALYVSEKCHRKSDKSHTGCDRNTVEMGSHSNSKLPPGARNFFVQQLSHVTRVKEPQDIFFF